MTRPLTRAEIALARSVFGDAIDLSTVVVHRDKYIFFQPDDTAMTPNGQIYFPEPVYRADFTGDVDARAWMVHELVHVWQHQQGVNVILAAPFARRYNYGQLNAQSLFGAYNIEQQASIVADYYYLTQGRRTIHGSGPIEQYRRIIPFPPAR